MHSRPHILRTVFCILVLLMFSHRTAPAQSLEDEIARVQEAISVSTNAEERKALEDYQNLLELFVSRQKQTPTSRSDQQPIETAIAKHNLRDFLAASSEVPLQPAQLTLVMNQYRAVCHDTLMTSREARKTALLQMAETYFKSEVTITGPNSLVMSRWFDYFKIIAPQQTNDESCSEMFEMLLVYMPDELTIYRRPEDGMSVLHLYAEYPVASYLSLMLSMGFDKSLKNNLGQTALDILNIKHPSPPEEIESIKPLLAP